MIKNKKYWFISDLPTTSTTTSTTTPAPNPTGDITNLFSNGINTYSKIEYVNNGFYIFPVGGTLLGSYSSPSGTSWSYMTSVATPSLGVVYAEGYYVGITQGSIVITTAFPNWTANVIGFSSNLYDVIYDGDQFLFYSSEKVTFKNSPTSPTSPFEADLIGPNGIGGNPVSSAIDSIIDESGNIRVILLDPLLNLDLSEITISGTTYYDGVHTIDLIEDAFNIIITTPYISDDTGGFVDYNEPTYYTYTVSNNRMKLNDKIIFIGYYLYDDPYGTSGLVYPMYSTDGINWQYGSVSLNSGFTYRSACNGVAAIIVSGQGTKIRTTDGINWSTIADVNFTNITNITTTPDGRFVAVQNTGAGTNKKLFVSDDNGITWTEIYNFITDVPTGVFLDIAASNNESIVLANESLAAKVFRILL